jgi:RNA polymerase sigma-70 factor, ECF subfamily
VQRDLLERAQHGDRESFSVVAAMSISRLYNIARLMLADSDLAEDAVQEALIITWRDLRGLRDLDAFDSWLRRILVRCVYRVAKGERRQVDRAKLVADGMTHTADVAVAIADRDEIDLGFRRLKPEFRAVLVVHHYLGLAGDEAAELLGVPSGTYKSRLNRATAAMRAELEANARERAPLAAGGLQ